jgi:hypothetical protein
MFYEQFRAELKEIGWPAEGGAQVRHSFDLSRAWKDNRLPIVAKGWGLDYLTPRIPPAFLWPQRLARVQRCQLAQPGVRPALP